jgi:hypothetical protein
VTDIVRVLEFFVSTGLLPALAASLVIAVVLTALALRQRWLVAPPWLAFAAVLSIVGVLAFTVLREGVLFVQAVASGAPLSPPGWQGLRDWSPDAWWRATADPLGSAQTLLNVALFVPAGLAWTLLTRRPWRVLVALGALSVVVEVVQGVTGLGANDVADIVANVVGAAVGTAAAVTMGWLADAVRGRAVGTRRWAIRGSAVLAVVVAAAVLPGLGAGQRQGVIADEAHRHFAGTSLSDIERWNQHDDLMDRVWRGVLSVDADGFSLGDGSAAARYPASFLSRRRCVLVTWDAAGASVERGAGTVCERPSL